MDFALVGGSSDGEATALAQGSAARAVGRAAVHVPFFAHGDDAAGRGEPDCVVLGTLVVRASLRSSRRSGPRRSLSKQKPHRDPTPPPEKGALERAYARQAVVGNRVDVGEHEPSSRPAV
jgi:hypothetical protein